MPLPEYTLLHLRGRFLGVLGVVLGLLACSPILDWREVRPAEAQGLVMVFPCKPQSQTRQVRVPGLLGAAVTMRVLTCEADGVTWALSYFDAGTPQRWRDAPAAWQNATLSNLYAMAATPASGVQRQRMAVANVQIPGSTPHPDAQTWWAQGVRPVNSKESEPVGVRVWHFTKGLRLFQASVWAPALQPDDPRWATFVNGIHFLP
jgi:hypothetical protein